MILLGTADTTSQNLLCCGKERKKVERTMSGYIMTLRESVGHRPLIMAAAGVILVNENGKILLQERSDNLLWGLPGGSMELGESFEEVARREAFEEMGLRVGEMTLFTLHAGKDAFYTYPNGDQVYVASAIFVSTDFSGEIVLDEETRSVRWYSPDELPHNLNPLDQPVLEAYATRVKQKSTAE